MLPFSPPRSTNRSSNVPPGASGGADDRYTRRSGPFEVRKRSKRTYRRPSAMRMTRARPSVACSWLRKTASDRVRKVGRAGTAPEAAAPRPGHRGGAGQRLVDTVVNEQLLRLEPHEHERGECGGGDRDDRRAATDRSPGGHVRQAATVVACCAPHVARASAVVGSKSALMRMWISPRSAQSW